VIRGGSAVARQMSASPALRRAVFAGMWIGLADQVACFGVLAGLAAWAAVWCRVPSWP
jgi:hypothetical protein